MLPRHNTYTTKIINIRRVVPKISVYKQTDKQTVFFWNRALLLFLNPPQYFFFIIFNVQTQFFYCFIIICNDYYYPLFIVY